MAAKWPSGGRASQAIKHKSSKTPSREYAVTCEDEQEGQYN